MHKTIRKSMAVWVVLTLLLAPAAAVAGTQMHDDDQVTAGKMTVDALIVRPLGIVATIAGAAIFVVSLPFSILGQNTGDVWNQVVAKPAKFTFTRPLGDM